MTSVLVCSLHPHGGGGTYALTLASGLDRSRNDVTLFCPCTDHYLHDRSLGLDCRVAHADQAPDADYGWLSNLYNVLADPYDIIHLVGARTAFLGIQAANMRLQNAKLVYSAINFALEQCTDDDEKTFRIALHRYICSRVSVTITNADRRAMVNLGLAAPGKIVRIANGIDTALRSDAQAQDLIRRQLALDKHIVLVFAGRLTRQKGVAILLHAFVDVAAAIPSAVLLVVGAGELSQTISAQIAKLRLNHRVRMLGWQESLHNILAIADIVVIPSLWEGLPYVALEAMALKRPVVASRVNGLCELITDGHDGLLVPAGESEPLSKTLIKLIGSADQRRDLGCAARATIVQQYSRELMLHRIQEIYEKLG